MTKPQSASAAASVEEDEETKMEHMEALVAHLVIYLLQPKALLNVLFASLPLLSRWPCPARSLCAALMQGHYQHIHTLVEQTQAKELHEKEASALESGEMSTSEWTQGAQCQMDSRHVIYSQTLSRSHVSKPRGASLNHLRLHLFEAVVDGLSWEQLATSQRVAPFMLRGHGSLVGPRYDLIIPREHLPDCQGPHPLPDIYRNPCPMKPNALCEEFLHLAHLDMQLHGGAGSLFYAFTWDPHFPCQSPPEEVFEYLCRARSPLQDILAFVRIWRRNFGLRAQSPSYCLDCRGWFCRHGSRFTTDGTESSNGLLSMDLSDVGAMADRLETYGCLTLRLAFDAVSLAKFFARDTDVVLQSTMERCASNAQDRYNLLLHGRIPEKRNGRQGFNGCTPKDPYVVAPRVWFYDALIEAWRPMGCRGQSLSSRGVRLRKTCGVCRTSQKPTETPPPFPWHVRHWWEQRNFTLQFFDTKESALEYTRETLRLV